LLTILETSRNLIAKVE